MSDNQLPLQGAGGLKTFLQSLATEQPAIASFFYGTEIRGITLRILYLLVAFSVVSTAGIMTSYFSLKSDNQLLTTQIEVLKIQYKIIDERLEKLENKKGLDHLKDQAEVVSSSPRYNKYAIVAN